jgi:hypothetical protein
MTLIVSSMCVCGDENCAFTASNAYQWVWSKWAGGMPSYASAPEWIDDATLAPEPCRQTDACLCRECCLFKFGVEPVQLADL